MSRPPRATDGDVRMPRSAALPPGPPLYLERRGQVTALLSPFMLPERLQRLEGIVEKRTRHLTILLEGVHDAHNIAACIRTCDAFGLQDLHIIPAATKPLKMSRLVASGADRWLTLHLHPDLQHAHDALKAQDYRVAITDLHSSTKRHRPADIELKERLCIAFGNERDGISPALRELADECVYIPMSGFVESLNISVAVGVAVSRIRERLETHPPERWLLSDLERHTLLDEWILGDVPHAESVLEEIARRQSSTLSGEVGSV